MQDDAAGDILSSHDDEPPYDGSPVTTARRRRSGVVLGSAALAVTLVAGIGVYSAGRLSGGGAQPESVLPGSTFAMIKFDLDPGGDQKTAIGKFARRFPAAKISDVEGLREKVLNGLAESSRLDYRADIKPWLGRRAALAAFSGPDGKPHVVAALQVTDPQQAKVALDKAKDDVFVAQRGGFLVLAGDQQSVDLAVAAADVKALADVDAFSSDIAALDGDQAVVAWVDNERAVAAMLFDVREQFDGQEDEFFQRQIKSMEAAARGRIVLGLHATSTYVELQGIARGDTRKPATGRPADLLRLPDTTIGALYVRDPKGLGANGISGFDLPMQTFSPFAIGWTFPALLFGGYDGEEFAPGEPVAPLPCPTPSPGADVDDYYCGGIPGIPEECLSASGAEGCPRPPGMSPECLKALEKWSPGDKSKAPLPECAEAFLPPPTRSPKPAGRALTSALVGGAGPEDDDEFGQAFAEFFAVLMPEIQNDLVPLLGGNTTVALGSLPAPGTDRAPDLALIADVSDERAAAQFADQFKARFSEQFAEQPTSEVKDGRLVLASDAAYRDRLGTGGLGDSELFRLAMGDLGDQVQIAVYANLERVRDNVPGYPADLRPVSAVGASIGQHDGHGYLRVRVVSR